MVNKQPTNLNNIHDFIRHRRSEIINEIANGMPMGIAGPGAPPVIKDEDKERGDKYNNF